MLYAYTAKNAKGEVYGGEADVGGKTDLYAKVRSEGGRLLSVKERGGKKAIGSLLGIFGGVGAHDKIIFAKNLSSMLAAGLPVVRALEVMERQSRKGSLKALLAEIREDVARGVALSEALAKRPAFPTIFGSMVKAGEESGKLSESLALVGDQLEKSYELGKRVKGALIYPAVILSLMVVISILLLIYMVPTLTSTFKGLGIELPLSTRVIIVASDFLLEHTVIVLTALVALLFLMASLFKSKTGQRLLDSVSLYLPVIGGAVRQIESARTARTLSSLLSAGVPILSALEVTRDVVPNHLYKEALDEAIEAIQKGETVSVVFGKHEDIYPPFVAEMAAVGEETGKIGEMLLNVARYYEAEVEAMTKDLSTIIEPVLMIVIGAGVGIFAISMLAPTYSLVNNI